MAPSGRELDFAKQKTGGEGVNKDIVFSVGYPYYYCFIKTLSTAFLAGIFIHRTIAIQFISVYNDFATQIYMNELLVRPCF